MKYIIKEPPKAGLTRDADALMREMNRAMAVVYDSVDQNNLSDGVVNPRLALNPVQSYQESTAVYGRPQETTYEFAGVDRCWVAVQGVDDEHSDYEHTLNPPVKLARGRREERQFGSFWSRITGIGGNDLALPITLNETIMGNLVTSGQINLGEVTEGAKRTMIFDVRLTDNGKPLDNECTVSCQQDGGFLPFFCSYRGPVVAGRHVFGVEARERSSIPVGADAPSSVVWATSIIFYGFTR
jgi:hypothetical protein